MNTLVGDLPRHLYVWVDSNFTHKNGIGYVRAVWFAIISHPGRAWGCTVMLESGAVYRNLPPHAICFNDSPDANWLLEFSQLWDCYGWHFSIIEYKYLSGLKCKVLTSDTELMGSYLFTVAPVGDGFSAVPEQDKEFTFVELDNGRLTIQPTNKIIFEDKSFTDGKLEFPTDLKRQCEIYSCE
jgi:hypothetical protein